MTNDLISLEPSQLHELYQNYLEQMQKHKLAEEKLASSIQSPSVSNQTLDSTFVEEKLPFEDMTLAVDDVHDQVEAESNANDKMEENKQRAVVQGKEEQEEEEEEQQQLKTLINHYTKHVEQLGEMKEVVP